jgi:hypothetical protein
MVSGQRQASAALYTLGKDPWYSLDGRLDRPKSRSAHNYSEFNVFSFTALKTFFYCCLLLFLKSKNQMN